MKVHDELSGSSGDCSVVGNQLCKHQFYVKVCLICVVESLISLLFVCFVLVLLFGNSAKDFPGVVPLSTPGEDQRKSAQSVSPLLLFTSSFFSAERDSKMRRDLDFLCCLLCFTPGCPSVFRK